MSATARLLVIEMRRSVGIWLFLAMVGLAWYASRVTLNDGIEIWVRASGQVGLSLVLLGPLAGGVAAWAAGRERWRGLEELVTTTPRSPALRAIVRWGGTTAWAVIAYFIVGAYVFIKAAAGGAWGSPSPSLLLVGLVAIVACAALGYLVGTYAPGLYAAPVTAVMLYVVLAPFRYRVLAIVPGLPRDRVNPVEYLLPTTFVEPSQYNVFHGIAPDLGPQLLAWLSGLTIIALASVALRKQPSWSAAVALILGCGTAVVGAVSVVGSDFSISPDTVRPYTPVCEERVIPVCVHPAYASVLDDTGDLIDGLVAPLVGIPGAPIRVEQDGDRWGMQPEGTLAIAAYSPTNGEPYEATALARELVQDSRALATRGMTGELSVAQGVVAVWLVQQSGHDSTRAVAQLLSPGREVRTATEWDEWQAEADSALERFSELSPEERREWLEDNFIALRAGEMRLEDLP